MKQTAVEYVKKKLQGYGFDFGYVLDQAKEMERRQKAEEYLKGFKDGKEYQIKLDELTFKSE